MLNFIPSNLLRDKSYFIKIFLRSSGLTNFSHSCVPIGTHEWEKFVKPEDLKKILMKYDLSLNKLEGMNFNILKDEWSISKDLSVNYIAKFIKY